MENSLLRINYDENVDKQSQNKRSKHKFKDVRAHCYRVSSLRTRIHTPRYPSNARAEQSNKQMIGKMAITTALCRFKLKVICLFKFMMF